MAAWFVRPEIALFAGLFAVAVSVWCALGLRLDDAKGEHSDQYVDEESVDLKELLSGNFEHPVRRLSNGMIALSAFSCLVALCRWHFS